jgi:tetratricopeptide (TPR) repeat protein
MPGKVEDIVMRRLDSLEPTALTLAEYCSCLGPGFNEDLVLSVTAVRDPDQGLDALERAGILGRQGSDVTFKHAMFREAIYNSISRKWRSAHHRSIGKHYETAYEGREDEVIYELARHFAHSGENAKAFEYCLRAGEKAETAFAIETAIEFCGWSLDALRTLPAQAEKELELMERVGDLMTLVSEFDSAVKTYNDALDLTGEKDLKARLHRKLAAVFWKIGRYDEALTETAKGEAVVESEPERVQLAIQRAYVSMRRSEFEEAITLCGELLGRLEGFPDSEREKGYVMDILGSAHHAMGDRKKALKWYETALEIMEREGDLRKVAALNNNIGNIYGDRLQNERSKPYYDRAIEIFENIGDKLGVSVLWNNIGAIHHSAGEPLKALECYERSLRTARAIGDQRMLSNGFGNLGATYSSLAEFHKTIEMFEKAVEAFEAMGDEGGRAWVLTGIGSSYHHLGDIDLGIRYMREGNAILEKIGDQWKICPGLLYLAHALSENGDIEEAETFFNKALELAKELDSPDNVADALYGLANIKADLPEALDLAKEAETVARNADLKIELGNALREHAKLLALANRKPEAEKKFEEAAAIFDTILSTSNHARLSYEWGKALTAWGEMDKGRKMLEKARESFAASDMRLWVERTEAVLDGTPKVR